MVGNRCVGSVIMGLCPRRRSKRCAVLGAMKMQGAARSDEDCLAPPLSCRVSTPKHGNLATRVGEDPTADGRLPLFPQFQRGSVCHSQRLPGGDFHHFHSFCGGVCVSPAHNRAETSTISTVSTGAGVNQADAEWLMEGSEAFLKTMATQTPLLVAVIGGAHGLAPLRQPAPHCQRFPTAAACCLFVRCLFWLSSASWLPVAHP